MSDKQPLFITGIGTGIGKTITSAVVVEKLKADYWKPIQSGDLDDGDTLKVQAMVSNPITVFHPEVYRLTQPYSPHKSAALDNVTIDIEKFFLPQTTNQLVIEGAGGLMVPLNADHLIVDLIKHLDAKVILVSQNYLGSINHTLLSISLLKQYDIAIEGIIFNGDSDSSSEDYILNYTGAKLLGRIPQLTAFDPDGIAKAGAYLSF
ncbi:dethiobiotin synthase [Mucilaginibacter roseus]|uniref:ATP-dependent dethiobiotin synthetase BioD n=1 Tax=Mucilaginibacter roseus TaxID=1528868 RepID=A0ABS8TWB2_9SPHI|nr:dethiobiotin synthase [Mucilaginibacter roseus]MCD8739165.1 dethiobiotin synthase [Mucilaginibacter roseus]